MIGPRRRRLLLRCYPAAWRARYGDELDALIADTRGGPQASLRLYLDVVLAAARERWRTSGLTRRTAPPERRSRAGALLVLCAWVALALAGTVVQKTSEHWQQAVAADRRGPPAAAFDVLVAAAAIGSVLVLTGLALAVPGLVSYLRRGGWVELRRTIVPACVLTVVAAGATVELVEWAHRLSLPQRNGADPAYAVGFVVWALLVAACLVAWTAAAVAAGRRIPLSAQLLRTEARLAAAVAVAMAVVTFATAVWWATLASSAPWFFAGHPPGTPGGALVPQLAAALGLMVAATAAATAGAVRAVRASR